MCQGGGAGPTVGISVAGTALRKSDPRGRRVLAGRLRDTCKAEINPLFVFFRVYLGTAEWKNFCWPPS